MAAPRLSRAPSSTSRVMRIPRPEPIDVGDGSIRSLECWSNVGCAGDRLSDAYAARAALAYGCRYGLNVLGRLTFVFLPGQGREEHDRQSTSHDYARPTVFNLKVTDALRSVTRNPL